MSQVTYEITATVEMPLVVEYERFMIERHIPDLIATGRFSSATFSRSAPGRYRIRYEARSREHLDKYLETDAPRLRAHMTEVFVAGIEFTREEWDVLSTHFAETDPGAE